MPSHTDHKPRVQRAGGERLIQLVVPLSHFGALLRASLARNRQAVRMARPHGACLSGEEVTELIEPHHLLSAVDRQTPMVITESTTEADEAASRATLGSMNNCGVGIQRYQGIPPWEIHRDSDELLYVLNGEMELTVVGDDGPETVGVSDGMIVIIPKGRWHRPVAKTLVTLFSATPFTNSDIAFSDEPPT